MWLQDHATGHGPILVGGQTTSSMAMCRASPSDFGLSIGNGGKVLFGVGDLSTSLSPAADPVNDGQWHHVVATRSGATGDFAVYVDGVLAGSELANWPGRWMSRPRCSSAICRPSVASFGGSLDFLTIYDSAMQADAVLDLYQGELPSDLGYTPNPTACILGGASTTGFPWARIGLERELARGTGPLHQQRRRLSHGRQRQTHDDHRPGRRPVSQGPGQRRQRDPDHRRLCLRRQRRLQKRRSGLRWQRRRREAVEINANGFIDIANGTDIWAAPIMLQRGRDHDHGHRHRLPGQSWKQGPHRHHLRRRHAAHHLGQSARRTDHPLPQPAAGPGTRPSAPSVSDPMIAGTSQPGSGEALRRSAAAIQRRRFLRLAGRRIRAHRPGRRVNAVASGRSTTNCPAP